MSIKPLDNNVPGMTLEQLLEPFSSIISFENIPVHMNAAYGINNPETREDIFKSINKAIICSEDQNNLSKSLELFIMTFELSTIKEAMLCQNFVNIIKIFIMKSSEINLTRITTFLKDVISNIPDEKEDFFRDILE